MRATGLVVTLVLGVSALGQDVVPAPEGRVPETIEYGKPKRYARIAKSAGDEAHIRKLAAPLKADRAEQTLRRIGAFVSDEVPHVPVDEWRAEPQDFDALVRGFDHRGCASHALVFANLARACGIPAVYVKSTRHEWIREYVATGKTGNFSGHVFLEVYVDGKWKLLDAQGMRIWDDYDVKDPELPGGLLAYEKGWDHYAMVHSARRDLYIKEATRRWRGFDVSKLRKNKASGRSLLRPAYAVTLSGEWRVLADRIPGLCSFDRGYWKQTIPKVRGNLLVVTSMGGRVEVPRDEAKAWLPVPLEQLATDAVAGKSSVRTRRLDDGTLVVLVAAPDWNALMSLIWRTKFASLRATVGVPDK